MTEAVKDPVQVTLDRIKREQEVVRQALASIHVKIEGGEYTYDTMEVVSWNPATLDDDLNKQSSKVTYWYDMSSHLENLIGLAKLEAKRLAAVARISFRGSKPHDVKTTEKMIEDAVDTNPAYIKAEAEILSLEEMLGKVHAVQKGLADRMRAMEKAHEARSAQWSATMAAARAETMTRKG